MRTKLRSPKLPLPARQSPVPRPASDARLPKFIGGPADAAARLRALKVAIVGLGSVGGRVALHLVRLAIAALWLVDSKFLKAESLLTHEIGPENIGKHKVAVIGERCRAISPSTRVYTLASRVEDLPMGAFGDADLVVLTTDNPNAELEVNRRCRQLGKLLIHASLHGESLVAHVRTYSNAGHASPCVGCGFSAEEWALLPRQTQFPCDGSVNPANSFSGQPSVSVSSHSSLCADFALNQILRVLLRLGSSVADTSLEYCGFTNRTVISPLTFNEKCPCDHRRGSVAPFPKLPQALSLADLAAAAGFNGGGIATFALEGWDWARLGQCRCATPHPVARFVASGQPHAGRCPRCRASIFVPPFFRDRAVSSWTLGAAMSAPLRSLGVSAVSCVLADGGQNVVLFRTPNT